MSADPWKGPQRRLSLSSRAWQSVCAIYADQMRAVPWTLRAGYRFMGGYLSFLERMQASAAKPSPRSTRPPLFIVGHWRSGTTFLHELLISDPQFSFPSTHACMNPQHFLLTERGAAHIAGDVVATRPMDSMTISSASPQEDEFALLCLGARSPYEAVLFPKALRRALGCGEFAALSQPEQANWRKTMSGFAAQVASRHPDKTLLLKSPPHGWRIAALRQLFPGARFIHIVRNPFDVAASTARMWEQLFAVYALTPPPYPEVMPDVAEFQARLLRRTDDELEAAADACVLRFEDLTRDPHGAIGRIYRTLDLGDYEAVRGRFATQLEKIAGHQKNLLRLSPAQRDIVRQHCAATVEKYGYP